MGHTESSAQQWDASYDVVVVGSGAAGLATALTADNKGCETLLVEKTNYIGGSSAISGGAIWAPLHRQSGQAGHPDTLAEVQTYLQQVVGEEAVQSETMQAFLTHAAGMVDYFAEHDFLHLQARTYAPDYYPDTEGAKLGGRSFDPLPFDARRLGRKHFKQLRSPLAEFLLLGGMMINVTDAKHLLNITKNPTSFKEGLKLLFRYGRDRLSGYHRGTRLLLGNALMGQLFYALLQKNIPYRLNTRLRALVLDEEGAVRGVELEQAQGQVLRIQARRGVVLATGGFPGCRSLREKYYPKPTGMWSMALEENTGDGLKAGRRAGARLTEKLPNPAFWAPVSIRQRPDGSLQKFPHLVWDRAKPGLLAVNQAGKRFVNESGSYHEFVSGMLCAHETEPSIPAFLICDSDFMEKWGMGLALPGGRPRQHLIRDGYLYQADSLEQLAATCGIDSEGLKASVVQMNEAAKTGVDEVFGKGSTAYNKVLGDPDHGPNPCLGPIKKAPFYAVKVYPGDIGTACGLICNAQGQVLALDGQAIPGLYAAGNDMQSVMAGAYPGPGITLGPALTFGWIIGQQLGRQPEDGPADSES